MQNYDPRFAALVRAGDVLVGGATSAPVPAASRR
jgi:hypothetical protein